MTKEYLSQEKFAQLQQELEELKTTRRKEVAEKLEFAKSLGDLAENAEYHSAREDQAEIEDRITQLESLIKNSRIVSVHHSVNVEIGSTLTVQKEGEKMPRRFTIVGSEEVDTAAGRISSESPLGSQLLGKKKGDVAVVQTPKGETRYKIVILE